MFGTSPIELMAEDAMLKGWVFCDAYTQSAEWITGTATALPASGTMPVNVQIDNDADFVIQRVNLVAYNAGPTLLTDPNYLLELISAGSGRTLMSSPQHVLNYCGSFQSNHVPNGFPYPKLMAANSRITAKLTNRTATAAEYVQLEFQGFKVYYIDTAQRAAAEGRPLATRETIFHAL